MTLFDENYNKLPVKVNIVPTESGVGFEIINGDGTLMDLPKNPLKEKWDRLYPPKPMPQFSQVCDGYSCMWCGRCPHGVHWEVPEEDKEVWDEYMQKVHEYNVLHGNLIKGGE